jgi:[protein-PII] uridylyltransferase
MFRREAFAVKFTDVSGVSELARIILAERDAVAAVADSLTGIETMRAYSDLTDALVKRIVECSVEEIEKTSETVRAGVLRNLAVAAVGGYGRREMSPFSDVDVAFIVDTDDDREVDLVVKRAFRTLMDVLDTAGLKVGYSYRKTDEVENLPLETQTALVDARCIAGSRVVFGGFRVALRAAIGPAAFVIGHIDGRANVEGQQDTPFVVEPDLKEGRGGLRDLHAARWIAQVAFGLPSDEVWCGLRSKGVLLDTEIEEVEAATEFVTKARNTLHLLAGSGLNILSVDRQAEVAERMGFAGTWDEPSDRLMMSYYEHAHEIRRIFQKVSSACLEQDLEIEPGVVARDGKLRILDRGLIARDNGALIRAFRDSRSYRLEISREAGDIISDAAQSRCTAESAGRSFLDILEAPGAGAVVRAMADLDVVRAVVPQFGSMMSLVPRDAAHQYTVGEHSLRAMEHLDAMFDGKDERVKDICSGIEHFDVLYLATLLHDLGKLYPKGDHARIGAPRARKIAVTLGMSEEGASSVEFLVRNHLRMSETARLRDLQQKKTIRDFAALVKDTDHLDMLLLLTIADARSVGGTMWSQVQVRFLLELYERTYAALRSPDAGPLDIDRHRKRVKRQLCLASLPVDEVDEHCAAMPAGYLLNMSPNELAAHIGYVRSVREGIPVVDLRDDRVGRFTELTVVCLDRPALLSSIAGVLHAIGIDIHAAQIFTRRTTDNIAIDILYVDYQGHQLSEMRKRQVEGELSSVLRGEGSVDELLRRWGKNDFKKPKILEYKVMENLSEQSTVIETRAADTPGLLRYLTTKFFDLGWDIHSARVATWGHEARDAFYVTGKTGQKLSTEELASLDEALGISPSSGSENRC